VPAKSIAYFKATIHPATGPDKAQYGGYIYLTPTVGGFALTIPFAGFIGDYQSIPVPYADASDMPWLVSYTSDAFPLTAPSE